MPSQIVQFDNVRKTYQMGVVTVEALRGVSLEIQTGEYVSIMGPSGCGKSTMLNLLGCLDRPSSGRYLLGAEDVSQMDDDALSTVRGTRLGFIFQSYNLIQQLTVLENIEVPLYYQSRAEEESRALAARYAARVGLEHRTHHKPFELSGGQQQRVAIARALVNDPPILLADEPTGNLDERATRSVFQLLRDINASGTSVIMATHNMELVRGTTYRTLELKQGSLVYDSQDEPLEEMAE